MKKTMACLLTIFLLFGVVSQSLLSTAHSTKFSSGKCGPNAYWSFDSYSGQLCISGSGKMTNYAINNDQPWYSFRKNIFSLRVSGVNSIGTHAFEFLYYLTNVSLPNTLTSIGECAFFGDDNLEKIIIPNSVTSVGNRCFCNCTGLTSAVIGNSLKEIPAMTFSDCQSLKEITISKNVKKISGGAFSRCYSLSRVYYGGSKADWKKIDMTNSNDCLMYAKIVYNAKTKKQETIKNLRCIASSVSAVKISWSKTSGFSGYQAQCSDGGSKWAQNKVTSGNSAVFSGLVAGGKYKFRVRAYKRINGVNYFSAWSPTLNSCAKPATVTLKGVSSPKHTQIKTIWAKAGGVVTGYQIVYSRNKAFTNIAARKNVTGKSTVTYTGKNFTKGRTYYIAVRAYTVFAGKTYYGKYSAIKAVKSK